MQEGHIILNDKVGLLLFLWVPFPSKLKASWWLAQLLAAILQLDVVLATVQCLLDTSYKFSLASLGFFQYIASRTIGHGHQAQSVSDSLSCFLFHHSLGSRNHWAHGFFQASRFFPTMSARCGRRSGGLPVDPSS